MPLEHFQKMVFSGFFGVPKNSECHLYNKICITSLTFYSWSFLKNPNTSFKTLSDRVVDCAK